MMDDAHVHDTEIRGGLDRYFDSHDCSALFLTRSHGGIIPQRTSKYLGNTEACQSIPDFVRLNRRGQMYETKDWRILLPTLRFLRSISLLIVRLTRTIPQVSNITKTVTILEHNGLRFPQLSQFLYPVSNTMRISEEIYSYEQASVIRSPNLRLLTPCGWQLRLVPVFKTCIMSNVIRGSV